MKTASVVFLFEILLVLEVFQAEKIVKVNTTGNENCTKEASQILCNSLHRAGNLVRAFKHDVRVMVESNLKLNSPFQLMNVLNVNITGAAGADTLPLIECVQEGAGFLLVGAHNFSFTSLIIRNCTLQYNITEESYHFAMLVLESSDILLRNVHFEKCSQTAFLLANNAGEVRIENSSFIKNTFRQLPRQKDKLYSSAITILEDTVNSTKTVNYSINSSAFSRNDVILTKSVINIPLVTSNGSELMLFRNRGYGGGVFVEFGGETTNSSVAISHSTFTGNRAVRGGGVYAYYTQSACKNLITITHSNFTHNEAKFSGGGVNIGFRNSPSLKNVFQIDSCNFSNNEASYGAALTIYSIYNSTKNTDTDSVIISNSDWCENDGYISSAVDVSPLYQGYQDVGFLPEPKFVNCSFFRNMLHRKHYSVRKQGHTHYSNTGVFVITRFRVIFSGTMTFKNNNFTALLLVAGTVEFLPHSSAEFSFNYGLNGGAIAMYGFSVVKLNCDIRLNFTKNHAIGRGGAIYHSTDNQRSFFHSTSSKCFFESGREFNERNSIHVLLKENTAEVSGAAMYSDSFDSCVMFCKGKRLNFEEFDYSYGDVFNCTGNFTVVNDKNTDNSSVFTSSGRIFNFTSDLAIRSCSDAPASKVCNTSTVYQALQLHCNVIPGDRVCLPFVIVDDFENEVHPLLIASRTFILGNKVSIREPYSLTNRITPIGDPNKSSEFSLSVLDVRSIYFYFTVTLLPCPPGYRLSINKSCICGSGKHGYQQITKCHNSIFGAQVKPNMWVGYIPKDSQNYTDLYFASCMAPLCNTNTSILPNSSHSLARSMCSHSRTGVMCGECVDNTSAYYHTREFDCGPSTHCSLGPLFYALSEVSPMTVFFLIVVTYDLSLTSGGMVSFIFYAQSNYNLVSTSVSSLFRSLHAPCQIFYGLFSFEFFEMSTFKFCLWKNASILDTITFKYVTVVIAVGMVLTFVVLKRCNWFNKLWRIKQRISAKSSAVHGLSAILMICYSQCTKTSYYILKNAYPIGYNGSEIGYFSYYGGLPYFGSQHLIYAVPALVSLVFVTVLPPLVLLLYPLSLHLLSLCGLSEHWLVNKTLRLTAINKLMPFFDCFQSCYKDKFRFFAGLYFLYRVLLLMGYSEIFSKIEIVILLGVHAIVQPYKRRLHNSIDILLFLNLALITGFALYSGKIVCQLDDPSDPSSYPFSVHLLNSLQLVLLYLPMLVLFLIMVRRVAARLKLKCCKHEPSRVSQTDDDDMLDYSHAHDNTVSNSFYSSSSISESFTNTQYGSI